jgi:hypothetical protein
MPPAALVWTLSRRPEEIGDDASTGPDSERGPVETSLLAQRTLDAGELAEAKIGKEDKPTSRFS